MTQKIDDWLAAPVAPIAPEKLTAMANKAMGQKADVIHLAVKRHKPLPAWVVACAVAACVAFVAVLAPQDRVTQPQESVVTLEDELEELMLLNDLMFFENSEIDV